MSQNISSDKAETNARESFGSGKNTGTSIVMKKVFFENDEYITYVLMKSFNMSIKSEKIVGKKLYEIDSSNLKKPFTIHYQKL